MYEDITHDEVKKLSDILTKWIEFNSKNNEIELNSNSLYSNSLIILQCYRDWELINKLYPKPFRRNVDIKVLMHSTDYFKRTGFLKVHSEKKILSRTIFNNIVSSIKTTLNILKLLLKKNIIILLQFEIANFLGRKKIHLYGDFIFSNLVVHFRGGETRLKLKKFLEKENINYNVDSLVEIIPDYLVELLEIYIFLSNRIEIKEVHSWVDDSYNCPLLIIKCLIDRQIFKVGYQHGGGYGFMTNIKFDMEYKSYDKFVFWGLTDKDIYPFRFTNNFKFIQEEREEYFEQNSLDINIYNDSSFFDIQLNNDKLFRICEELSTRYLSINLIIHPYDYAFTISKFKLLNNINFLKGEKNFFIKNNSINLLSVGATLFWKMIVLKKNIICIYSDNIVFSDCYNFWILKLLKNNRLIYSEETFLEEINQISFEDIFQRNINFYNQLTKLFLNN